MPRLSICAVLLAATCYTAASAADRVILPSGDDGGAGVITGEVLEYSSQGLVVRLANGRERKIAAERIERVEPQRSEAHATADDALARGDLGAAIDGYRQALSREPRRWVRRQLLAQLVGCYRRSGQVDLAGETFLVLARDDPASPHFACIPLAWSPSPPNPALVSRATRWLEATDQPAAVLLGASHLLATQQRGDAAARLTDLSGSANPIIASLSAAQLWRTQTATATPADLSRWESAIENMPESVRVGPYFVLGLAYIQKGDADAAAMALLRVAFEYPQDRNLAAESLLRAGEILDRAGHADEALTLFRELGERYPDTPFAEQAARHAATTTQSP